MQQTQKYQFNLIESSDAFSAQPLNDNAVKLETALAAHRAEVDAALTAKAAEVSQALDSRARVIAGSYTGTGEYGAAHPCSIELDPALGVPTAIFVVDSNHGDVYLFMEGVPEYYAVGLGYNCCPITWTGRGASWYNKESAVYQMNLEGRVYPYIILF